MQSQDKQSSFQIIHGNTQPRGFEEKRKAGIDKSKRVYHQVDQPIVVNRDTLEEVRYKVKQEAIDHVNRVIPYYFEKEFYRAFEGMLKQNFKG